MRKIKLSNSRHAVIVDSKDFNKVSGFTWRLDRVRPGAPMYAATTIYHPHKKTIQMHQLVMPLGQSDHKDGNGLNNRRSNLRYCSGTQNQANQKLRSDNSTGFKGVRLCKQTNRFSVRVGKVWVGRFPTKEIAAQAYDESAIKIFGAFAKTNQMLKLNPANK